MNYDEIINVIQEYDLSWDEIDRIELNEKAFQQFSERTSFNTSNFTTSDKPAVRQTNGKEKIVYTQESGFLAEIIL
jgi:hypothetical protein